MTSEQDIQKLVDEGNFAQALSFARQNAVDALQSAALIAAKIGDKSQTINLAKLCLDIQPNNPYLYGNLSFFHGNFMQLHEALDAVEKALSLSPDSPEFKYNRAIILSGLAKVDDAIPCYREILKEKPDCQPAKFNLGCLLMLKGQFREGLTLLEARFENDAKLGKFRKRFTKPDWDGKQDIKGKKLLIYSEQGCGDVIQNVRYTSLIPKDVYLIAEMHKELAPLFTDRFDEIVGRENNYNINDEPVFPEYDYVAAFSSLPYLLDRDLKNIPKGIYVKVKPNRMKVDKDKLNVGIAWCGNPNHPNDTNRSMEVKSLLPLSKVKGVQMYSLQKGDMNRYMYAEMKNLKAGFEELGAIDLSNKLTDFYKTAQMIDKMDLVITVDTSVAHLAGAMGKPTWVMLPYCRDHRWLLDENKSIWYDSVRLFTQKKLCDWTDVVKEVSSELKKYKRKLKRAV